MNDDLELSRLLTGIVAATAGVGDVYPSGTLAQAVTLTIVNTMTGDERDDAKVAVSREASGRLVITATIGVSDGHTAQTTLRSVSDAIRTHLTTLEPGSPAPAIEVKVSRIETESNVLQPRA